VRERAWREALTAAGLACPDSVDGGFSTEGATRATHRLLDAAQPPTAIVYASDLMAIAGIGVARDRGLRVPDDLSVIGFDDISLAEHIAPPLTTVRQEPVAAGRLAAAQLLATLDGAPPVAQSLPEPTFVVRASTAPPP
jgi:DNA-binding LacI/PurR family transcriptional regulator